MKGPIILLACAIAICALAMALNGHCGPIAVMVGGCR